MSIKEQLESWEELDEKIRDQIENIRQLAVDIEYENDYDPELSYPPGEQSLKTFTLTGDTIYTFWEYIDGYESICDSSTQWFIPLKWFDMTREELSKLLVKEALDKREKDCQYALSRLKINAEYLGYKLIEKEKNDEI